MVSFCLLILSLIAPVPVITNGVKDVLTSEFCASISIYVNDAKSNIYNATWLSSKITAESTGYILTCYI